MYVNDYGVAEPYLYSFFLPYALLWSKFLPRLRTVAG